MANIGYKIGTQVGGAGGLQYLEDLGVTIPFPTPFNHWSIRYDVLNGEEYGDGSPEFEWHFSILTMVEMAILLGYVVAGNQSKIVSVSTKDDLDVWDDYYAVMHRPTYPDQGGRRPGKLWRDVVFKFSMLEAI